MSNGSIYGSIYGSIGVKLASSNSLLGQSSSYVIGVECTCSTKVVNVKHILKWFGSSVTVQLYLLLPNLYHGITDTWCNHFSLNNYSLGIKLFGYDSLRPTQWYNYTTHIDFFLKNWQLSYQDPHSLHCLYTNY